MNIATHPLAPEELLAAQAITAELLATQQSLRAFGDYVICSQLSSELPDSPLQTQFTQGLVEAGSTTETAQALYEASQNIKIKRLIFSLNYISKDVDVAGVRQGNRSVSLNKTEFIRGIIHRAQTEQQAAS